MMLDIIPTVDTWLAEDTPIALATVTKTWGSAPRREGSKLAVTPELAMIGSVSGGCVEGAVIEDALSGLQTGTAKLLSFGVADDTAWEVGLTCGGRINVFVEALDTTWWTLAKEHMNNNQRATTITVLAGDLIGEKIIVNAEGDVLYQTTQLSANQVSGLQQIALTKQQSSEVTWQDTQVMVDILNARPHLIIVGGVHVAIPLEAMARMMGFRVSIIDPRQAFASPERFPDVDAISHDYPTKTLEAWGLDSQTYLAVLTHDPKIDDQALITALPANIPYIGVLSSRRTHEKRKARLKDAGISDDLLKQIRTPIGIGLGGRTPEEIALGIMSEIIAVRNGVREEVSL